MTTREENERLCRIGPGTAMGAMFRRFWMPIALSSKLREAGGPPRHERLLGEDFVVFRDTGGRIGVLDELCMHRGASLVLGRVEDCGIRCLYHGWKFDVDGNVVDMMNNSDRKLWARMKAPAYPVREAGGIVWTYLGPKEKEPPFPHFRYFDLPASHCVNMRVDANANWVQATEGGLDSSHVGILHTNAARPAWQGGSDDHVGELDDTAPTLEIEDTDFGYHYGAVRKGAAGRPDNVRIVPFFMPSGRIIPDIRPTGNATIIFEVPIDDENTATYSVRYGPKPIERMSRVSETGFDDPEFYDEESGKFLMGRRDYHMQKRHQMGLAWSGFRGIALEDAVIATSQGPIYDRTKEHLIASDLAVVRFRRRVLDAAARVERGEDPLGLHVDSSRITAIDAPMPPGGRHWRSLVPDHRVAGKEPVEA
ncbi:MAG TPA: Rieske 2Fe-2S domain-containing protein [Hyphomicrobiales bacterium]|nr:Rieske 2Fe-2S domain-containing protein [Hyphomicrobiales bacterium]